MEQIGNEQQPVGHGNRLWVVALMCVQRVQRIERHELNAGRAINSIGAEFRYDCFIGPRIARIAVRVWRSSELAGLVEQCPIDSPSVDANRDELHPVPTPPVGRLPQAGNDFTPDAGHIPMQTGRQPNRLMQKPVNLLQPQSFVLKNADNYAARFGAEIDGNVSGRHAAYRIRRVSNLQSIYTV